VRENFNSAGNVLFLGVVFKPIHMDEVLQRISEREVSAPFTYVVTPNVDHIVRLHAGKDRLMPLYYDAWMCLCDSKVLQLLARIAMRSLPVVRGSDLTARLFTDVIKSGDHICVIGGDDKVVDLLEISVGSDLISHYNPPMGFVESPGEIEKCVEFIIDHPSRYVFLAVGSPQQEIVARAVQKTGKATGTGFCIGASIDFLTGKEVRSPNWMQKCSIEWLFRLLQDPKRLWRRYLLHGPVIFLIFLAWLFSRPPKNS